MTRNSRRLQKAVQAIFNDYREKASCPGQVYQNAACGCDNALQMWRGPKGDKGDQGPQGPKGDNAGSFLVDAEFVVDPEGQEPGAYLKLVLIDVAQQEQVVYVDLSYLTDIYEGGNGISIVDMVVAARLGAGLTFDANGNIASAYQFCDGLDETSNVVKVRLDASNRILGFASGTCGGLTATVGLAPSATGVNLVLTGADGAVLSTVPLEGGTGITVQKNAQTGGFTWLADPAWLVSSQTGNQLSVSQTDNKLYVGGNTLEYTFGTGAFTLKDSSGATLSSVTVPSAVRMLENMELRTDDGIYLHLTYLRDNGLHAYQDVSLDELLCNNVDTADDTTAAYSKVVPSGNWQTASINEIGGRTVAWNQLYNYSGSSTRYGVTVNVASGIITITGTAETTSISGPVFSWTGFVVTKGHKFIIRKDFNLPEGSYILDQYNSSSSINIIDTVFTTAQSYIIPQLYVVENAVYSVTNGHLMVFDLTLMFGAGNEPATVAEFEAMFPSVAPAYNAGELKSAGVTEVVSEGRNILPPSSNASATSNGVTFTNNGNGTYTLSGTATGNTAAFNIATNSQFFVEPGTYTISAVFDGTFPAVTNIVLSGGSQGSGVPYTSISYTSPSNQFTATGRGYLSYIQMQVAVGNAVSGIIKIQIERGTTATAYTPYRSPISLPIPAAVQALPGYGWSAGTVYNYVDYARKVYVQRVGSVDLGTLTWTYDATYQRFGSSRITDMEHTSAARILQMVCSKYEVISDGRAISAVPDKSVYATFYGSGGGDMMLCVHDTAYNDATAFKTAMSGVMLQYPLKTPIETDISSLLTDTAIEVEPGGSLTFKNQHNDFRLPVPNSETFIYEHPWVFEDCVKELVWKELEPYSSSIAGVSASFSCGSDYTWYISALHPWCDTEGDDCGGTVYSAPAVMPALGTDIVMPAKILEKYSSVDIVISTAPISIITTDTSPTEFKYVTDAAHADAPYMAYELYSPYGAYYSFISAEEWAAASVGDLVELVSGRNVVEEHRAFKGAGNFDGSQLPPMQQCPLSDIPFRVFVVKETDSAIPDWPTGDIHIRVLQREGVEIPVTPTTLTLTTTDISGETHEQEIDMSCISADISLDAGCREVIVEPATAEPFDDYLLSGSINTLLLNADGTISDLKHANAIPTSSTARGSFTMELFNPSDTDGLSFELYAKQSSGSDSQNYYSNITPDAEDPQKCATLADFLAAGEQGLPLAYVEEIPSSGVTPFAENETLYASVVSNGNNSYTFTFTVRTPDATEKELTLDLVSGENRTDLKPILEHVGGKINMVAVPAGDAVQLSFGYAGAGYIFGSRRSDFPTVGLFANSAEDICAQTNLIQPTSVGPGADTFTYYFDTLPTHFAIPSISEVDATGTKVGTTSYASPMLDMETMRCTGEGTVLADIPEAGLVYTEYDTSSRPFVPTGRTLRLRATVGNAGIVFTLWKQETVDKPVLCLEPSCDSCIDLSPVMDTVEDMIDEKIAPVQEQITQNASDIDALETKTDVTNKNVENILLLLDGTVYRKETDNIAAYSKTVPTSALRWASMDMIGGKTVAWNQKYNITRTTGATRGVSAEVANGVVTLSGTANATGYGPILAWTDFTFPAGHKVIIQKDFALPSGSYIIEQYNAPGITDATAVVIAISAGNQYVIPQVYVVSGKNYDGISGHLMVIDLTLMFGAGNEPATVDAFRAMFPAAYYAYDAGTLKSAGVTEVVSEGKNLFNFSAVTSGENASGSATLAIPFVYDATTGKYICSKSLGNHGRQYAVFGDEYLDAGTYTVSFDYQFAINQADVMGITVALGDGTNSYYNQQQAATSLTGHLSVTLTVPSRQRYRLCIMPSNAANQGTSFWNIQIEKGSSATSYSPYFSTPYPIPSAIQALPGYGWSAGTVYNYVDYERKVYVQNVGSVDLGAETTIWFYSGAQQFFSTQLSDASNTTTNAIVQGYTLKSAQTGWANMQDFEFGIVNGSLRLHNSAYTNSADFKNSLQGKKAYYELATPVETDISQYLSDDNLINVEAGGTLTFRNQHGDDFRLPVPNEETYIIDIQEAVSNG